MSISIRSENDLNRAMQGIAKTILQKTQNQVSAAVDKSIKEYYKECSPFDHSRTKRILNGLIDTKIVTNADECYCEVSISKGKLNRLFPYTDSSNPYVLHDIDSRFALSEQLDPSVPSSRYFPNMTAPVKNHSCTVGSDCGYRYSDMDELGDVITLLKTNLNRQNIQVI